MVNSMKVLGITLMIFGLITFVFGALILTYNLLNNSPPSIRQVGCYDRYSNLIVGEVCEEKYYPGIEFTATTIFFLFLAGFLLGFLGLTLFLPFYWRGC